MVRLAIVTTHPIQYHAAWFRALAEHPAVDLEVLFCHNASAREQADAGFAVDFEWDISLLDGYRYRFLNNIAESPTIASFRGLDTPEIFDVLSNDRFDAVMVNGWHYKSAWQTMRACWRTRTAVMMRSDSHLHSERTLIKRVSKWPFYRCFISKLDACLPVGSWSRDYFLHYGARPERTRTVPHAVDTDYFSAQTQTLLPGRLDLRNRWGLRQEDTVFLFAGKFVKNKRPFDFVDAIEKAAKMGSPVSGLMVGDGPLRRQCEEMVAAKQISIKFAGFLNQSEITTAYVASDALVLPSRETWGLVVNEAMTCGLPCLVSDEVGAGPDMVIRNQTGGVFALGDTSGLADQMVSCCRPHFLQGLGQQAKRMAAKYSVGSATNALLEAVEATTEASVIGRFFRRAKNR